VLETPTGTQASKDFGAGANGVFSDVATGKQVVPALRYDNPNVAGNSFVKFDGIEQALDGTYTLIDAKTALAIFHNAAEKNVIKTLERVENVLKQNPGYKVMYEFPNEAARAKAEAFIAEKGFKNVVGTRVRPM
jgi:filamentous hemagglutinin